MKVAQAKQGYVNYSLTGFSVGPSLGKSIKRGLPQLSLGMVGEIQLSAGIQALYLQISADRKLWNQSEVILFIAYSDLGTQGFFEM